MNRFFVPFAHHCILEAKVKSDLNWKFQELVKKYNLEYYEMVFLTIRLGHGYWDCIHPFGDATDFIMETSDLTMESIQNINNLKCLEEIFESEFYIMKTEQAEAPIARIAK
ncbi:hypothetical protein [uncultured Methanomethylovorans sp.]|uniref:hypothetical protein n=1 Tax=uncultured Methanomethylovorans sp. TaxID=183759 RepID=UPI00374A7137